MSYSNLYRRSRLRAYITGLLALGSVLGVGNARAEDLSPGDSPNFGSVTLKEGFLPDPFKKNITAGGSISTRLGGTPTWVSKAPDFRLYYTAGTAPLRFLAESKGDTTLLINLPNGTWIANDDGGGNNNPQVIIAKPQSGRYDIYVGTFGSTKKSTVAATLHISELRGTGGAVATPKTPALTGMGIRVDVQVGPTRTTLVDRPNLFHDLAGQWNNRKVTINGELEKLLGSLSAYAPKGVAFVRMKSTVGTAVIRTQVSKASGLSPVKVMEIAIDIKGNSMRTRVTQPTPLGSDADPELLLTYDLRGRIFIPVASDGKRLAVSKATFESYNVKIDPRNTTAKALTWFDKTFFDSRYKNMAENLITKKFEAALLVNQMLEPVNAKLATIPGEITTVVEPGFYILLTPRRAEKGDEIRVN